MRLEHYSQEKLKKEIMAIIGRHLDLARFRVFFFGSRVSGGGSERSDIDVGIEGSEPVPLKDFFAMQEEIENIPTLYKIEVVDFKRVSSVFKKVALEHIELITQT